MEDFDFDRWGEDTLGSSHISRDTQDYLHPMSDKQIK